MTAQSLPTATTKSYLLDTKEYVIVLTLLFLLVCSDYSNNLYMWYYKTYNDTECCQHFRHHIYVVSIACIMITICFYLIYWKTKVPRWSVMIKWGKHYLYMIKNFPWICCTGCIVVDLPLLRMSKLLFWG